ncbi:Uncharacterised protein [Mycoplasmopsis columboralis]|uniref:Uncharacterized protein n=1 Tax=Mycoplasmopsis columboralis TaxID=171282 RepID=A0A449B6W3_9BACT|nr:hypothetical protein [Mycoplasmopsis columboralis]VEU76248.1 Uncharacterised protein [Mycoplasmopsis columboralis]
MQGKWYAWNPEIDPKQRELIEPYLKKENGEYLLDQNNNKIPNSKYDPLINPKTGTKEEILWVNYSKFNLPEDTRFLQDPRDKQGNFIHINDLGRPTLLNGDLFDIELGFIAQGSVVGKGINVSSNSEIEQAKRFFISSNLQDSTFDTNIDNSTNTSSSGNKISISKNENDYFSSSGLWMYTIRDKGNIDTYKLFLIGKNEPSALFSQVYSNPSVIPFWSSYHGKNLAKFLLDNNYVSEQKLSSLKYEEVINFWKIYVSSTYKFVYGNEDNEEDNSYIHGKKISDNSIISPKDKITLTPFVQEDQLKEFAKTISEKDFSKYNKQHWEQYAVIAEKAKDKIDFDVESKNNEIVYSFYFKEESFNSLFTIKKSVWNVAVKWKEDVEFENTTQKVEITPSINGSYLSSITETAFDIQDIVANIDRVRLLDFNDSDKVNFDITIPFNNVLRFEFNVKRSYQNNYFISREKQFIYVDLNDIFVNLENKYINIFSNFNLTNLNLNGETDFLKAKNIILKAIENAINKQYKYKIDFDIENFDNVVKNAIKVVSSFKDPIYFDLYLNSINTTNNNLVGRRRISLTNAVKNNFIPSNVNLINYSISNIELKQITTFKELYSEIIKNIDNDLRAYRINFNDYLTIENVSELEKLLTPNKINTINLKLRPLNNILKGTKIVKITNDLISITETDLTLNKEKNKYTKEQLQELKDKLDKSKNSDFGNKNEEETAKNEWEDGFVDVRKTDKNNNSENPNNTKKETLTQQEKVGISFGVIGGTAILVLFIIWAIKTKFGTKPK